MGGINPYTNCSYLYMGNTHTSFIKYIIYTLKYTLIIHTFSESSTSKNFGLENRGEAKT